MSASAKSRLPDFLIIGAMKAGTTTLFRDLETQRSIFFPYPKEPNNLCSDEVLSDEGIVCYSNLFRGARPDQLCGEASTNYTKLPTFSGVTRRARQILRPDLKLIYIVREPVARVLSHHRDRYLARQAPADFEEYLRQGDHPINVSRYAMQIEPWIEAFGRQQVHIIQLESYARNRRQEFADLCDSLGIDPQFELVKADAVYNASKAKAPHWLAAGPLGRVLRTHWYQNALRPWIPDFFISVFKRSVLKAPPLPPPPRLAVIDEIIDRVRDDAERLRHIMGRDEPLWDFEAVRRKYADVERSPAVLTS